MISYIEEIKQDIAANDKQISALYEKNRKLKHSLAVILCPHKIGEVIYENGVTFTVEKIEYATDGDLNHGWAIAGKGEDSFITYCKHFKGQVRQAFL